MNRVLNLLYYSLFLAYQAFVYLIYLKLAFNWLLKIRNAEFNVKNFV